MTASHAVSWTLIALAGLAGAAGTAAAQASDVPKQFTVRELPQPFIRREAMIPMRDGVKLRTVLYLPKGATRAPMMLERTPYNVDIFAPGSRPAHSSAPATSWSSRTLAGSTGRKVTTS